MTHYFLCVCVCWGSRMVFQQWHLSTGGNVPFLNLTERHGGIKPNHVLKPKRRINWFSECTVEGVEVAQCLRAD